MNKIFLMNQTIMKTIQSNMENIVNFINAEEEENTNPPTHPQKTDSAVAPHPLH